MPDFKQEPYPVIQMANPVEQYQNMLKTQYLATEIAKANRAEDDSEATSKSFKDALQPSLNPDGSLNVGKFRSAARNNLITNNRGSLVQGFDKANADTDQANAKAGLDNANASKAEMETLAKTFDNFHEQYKSVSQTDPQLAQQQLYSLMKAEAVDPAISAFNARHDISPEQYLQGRLGEMQDASKNPESMRQYVIRQQMGSKEAADTLKRQIHVIDGGDHNTVVSTDPNALNGQVQTLQTTPRAMADHSVKVTVNANNKAANAFGETLGKDEANSYSSLEGIARNAPSEIAQLDNMIDKVKSGQVYTGIGAGALVNGNRIGKFLNQNIDNDKLTNTQELQKYMANNILQRTAELNKAGLGSRTSVQELKMLQDANVRGDMEPMSILHVLLNQRKTLQDSIPHFNQRSQDILNSPDPTMPAILKTLASHKLDEIPDHPLAALLSGGVPAGPTGAAPIYHTPTAQNIADFNAHKNEPGEVEAFEKHFGPGSAKKYGGQ